MIFNTIRCIFNYPSYAKDIDIFDIVWNLYIVHIRIHIHLEDIDKD